MLFIALPALIISQGQPAYSTDYLSFGIGYYDVLDDDEAVDLRIEYRPDSPIFVNQIKPWVGAEITSEATIWLGAGILYDWNFHDSFYLTPSFGAGLYVQGGSDLDLDYPIEFRSQLELAYEFETEQRLGLQFSHLSNASFGDSNPGTEVLGLYWHVPF